MIFVTVGTAIGEQSFDRLIKKMDEIALRINEDIIIQKGESRYIPKNAKWFDYLSYNEILYYFQNARLVIGHCGSGTIINSLINNVPLIVVPRSFNLGEIQDEHQIELAKTLERYGVVDVVYNIEELECKIREVINKNIKRPNKTLLERQRLIDYIKNFINSIK